MDLEWDEDEVTKPTGTALLPIVPINPRIRIIHATKALGSAPGLGDTGLERTGLERTGLEKTGLEKTGLEKTGLEKTGLEKTGLGHEVAAESRGEDEPVPTTKELLTGTPEEREFDERETTEREQVRPEALAPDEDSGVLVAPIVNVEGPPPPSSVPTWEDMTVPRHARDLRDRARRLAALSKDEKRREGLHTDEQDAPASAQAPDTRVDEVPAIVSRQPSMRILSFDRSPGAADPHRDALPMTLPRQSAIAAPPSVDVDLSSLDPYADTSSPSQLSMPAATPQVRSTHDEEEEEEAFPKPQTDWLPLEEHAVVTAAPRARRPSELRSVPPVTMSSPSPGTARRRGIAIAAFGVMLILCSTIFVLWMFPKKGAVMVRLRTEDGHPAAKAEIYVDGQKRCDTDPCLIEGLPRGDRTIKVIVPGSDEPRVANVEVQPGTKEVVWIEVPSTVQAEEQTRESEPEAVPPRIEVRLATLGARVVLIPEGGMGKVLEGPFPLTLDLPFGRYEIVASLPGYAPFVDHVALSEDDPTAEVDVKLVKRGTKEADDEGEGAEEPRVQKHSPYWDPYADVEWD